MLPWGPAPSRRGACRWRGTPCAGAPRAPPWTLAAPRGAPHVGSGRTQPAAHGAGPVWQHPPHAAPNLPRLPAPPLQPPASTTGSGKPLVSSEQQSLALAGGAGGRAPQRPVVYGRLPRMQMRL